ncbi:MAG: hypothetical protein QNJ41_23355 [Xenococcaceae cyanobacterium MO_188.B32]|nr:hypothetical protein [Xenococcaceae cyanobacterium MO_188.B32]
MLSEFINEHVADRTSFTPSPIGHKDIAKNLTSALSVSSVVH